MAKRPRCSANTQKGTRCTRHTLDDLDVCLAHAPKEVRDSRGFGGPQEGSGRPPKPRLHERMLERLDERIDEVIDVMFANLEAQRPVVVGQGHDAELEMVPDPIIRQRAAEAIYDRAHGRPRQAVEITGEDGGAVKVEDLLNDKALAKLDELADQIAAARKD